jgi:hypothetical protein
MFIRANRMMIKGKKSESHMTNECLCLYQLTDIFCSKDEKEKLHSMNSKQQQQQQNENH